MHLIAHQIGGMLMLTAYVAQTLQTVDTHTVECKPVDTASPAD